MNKQRQRPTPRSEAPTVPHSHDTANALANIYARLLKRRANRAERKAVAGE
jgi:hypothetical protein